MTASAMTISTSTDEQEEFARVERRARRFWVTFIVGFLGLQVLIGFGSVYLALGDPSVAIIPNYHQSALDWDIQRRAHQMLDQLGWQVQASVAPAEAQRRTVGVRVTSPKDRPVEKLRIDAKMFHHARGQAVYNARLTETEPGVYLTTTQLTMPGLWQIDLTIEGDHGIARDSLTIEVD